jgi:hypothetical protein
LSLPDRAVRSQPLIGRAGGKSSDALPMRQIFLAQVVPVVVPVALDAGRNALPARRVG